MIHKIFTQREISRPKAIVFLILTAVLWSFGGLLIKLISWNPIAIAGVRSAIAALLLLLVIRRPRLTWSVSQIGGAIAYAVTVILFVMATKLTTAANTILLQYTAPIYVAVFGAWFLKERANWTDWITIFLVIGGMVLFFMDDLSSGGILGNVLAIISGISFGSLIMFMRRQKDTSPLESCFLGPVLEPILNPVWVLLIMGESPGLWDFVGGFIVLASITLRCVQAVAFYGFSSTLIDLYSLLDDATSIAFL